MNNFDRVASLTLCNLNTSVEIFIETTNIGGNEKYNLIGRTNKPIVQETDRDLTYVIFHLVNFHLFHGNQTILYKKESGELKISHNRVLFEVEKWRLTLDQLETAKDITEQLQVQGGFAITHVGKIEKLDGQTFSGDEVKEVKEFLEIFADFLSFARGFRVSIILLVGYDAKENQIWQHWDSLGGATWRQVSSWCPTQDAGKLAEIFPGFLRWWQDWEESEKLALYWYLEVNHNPLIQQKIVLVQVALELLSWVLLVEKEQTITQVGFDKLPASDKLRLLLSRFKISLKIPPKTSSSSSRTLTRAFIATPDPVKELVQLAKSNNWVDGLHALTEMRNGIVHPERKKRQKIHEAPFEAKFDAADLGLWYLELVLLAIFGYQGHYTNRLLKLRQNGETEVVPWSNQ